MVLSQGAPSYLLLLYLLQKKNPKFNKDNLESIVKYLVLFFVRRNLTDRPATNSLTPLFMKIIEEIDGLVDDAAVEFIKNRLVSVSSSDEDFLKTLEDPIYSENSAATRFILCAIEEAAWEKNQSEWKKKEVYFGLWDMKENHKQYVWTIEHIFPRSKNIPACWVDMIAGGDKASAKIIQEECVDCIGNLTLSGINQELSNKCFEKKKTGYDNKLFLNKQLDNCNKWNKDQIMQRTTMLANEALNLFALGDKNKIIETQQNKEKPNPMDRFFLDADSITIIKRGDGKPTDAMDK